MAGDPKIVGNWTNITDRENVYTPWVPAGLEFLFGVIGNAIALTMLIRTRNVHTWKSFYILYCGLAVTDFCGIAFVYPFVMKRYASDFTWSIKSVPGLCDFMSFMWMWGLMSTGLIICAMSLNRFHTIFFTDPITDTPGRHMKKKYMLLLAVIWLFSCVLAILPIAGVGENNTFYPGSWCFLDFVSREVRARIISYIYSIVGLTIFALTALVNIITIAAVLLHRSRGGVLFEARQVAGEDNTSILIFLCAVFVVFGALWTPLMVNILQHATLGVKGNDSTELLVLRLSIANSIVDPWIYIMSQTEIRRRLRKFLCCNPDEERRPLLNRNENVTENTSE